MIRRVGDLVKITLNSHTMCEVFPDRAASRAEKLRPPKEMENELFSQALNQNLFPQLAEGVHTLWALPAWATWRHGAINPA